MMRWLFPAILASLAVHGAVLGVVRPGGNSQPGSEAQVTSTVIVFDTPPAPAVSAASGADDDASPANGSTVPREAPQSPLADLPEDVAEAEPEPVTQAEPEPVAEPVAEPEPAPAAAPATDPIETATVPDAPPVPLPRVKPPLPDHVTERIEREQAEAAAAEARRKAEAARKAKEREARAEARRKRQADKAAANAGARKAGKSSKQAASSASRQGSAGRQGGASAGDKRAYARSVLSHIQRFKRYPSGTTASGVVRLAVSISGSGAIRSASVRGSSGHAALDRAAVATARAASPYPAPPGGGGFSFTVALRYKR